MHEDGILNYVIDSYAEGRRSHETDEEDLEVVPIRGNQMLCRLFVLRRRVRRQRRMKYSASPPPSSTDATVRGSMVSGL